jgi:protein-S-isoprenylcysteine O-methyltransferase Ste14
MCVSEEGVNLSGPHCGGMVSGVPLDQEQPRLACAPDREPGGPSPRGIRQRGTVRCFEMRSLLAVKSVVFVLLLPGTVAGYVPYRILRSANRLHAPRLTVSSVCASLMLALGLGVLLRCVWDFAAAGRGTLAPVDPPQHLVVRGLYRFTRNPMYNGVLASLLAEAWLFHSAALLQYSFFVLAGFHLVVVLYEERALAGRFGAAYAAYRSAVPRWGFTFRGYREPESTG